MLKGGKCGRIVIYRYMSISQHRFSAAAFSPPLPFDRLVADRAAWAAPGCARGGGWTAETRVRGPPRLPCIAPAMTGCVCLGRGWCGFGRFGAVGRVVGEMVLCGAVLVCCWPARLKYKDNLYRECSLQPDAIEN